MLKEPKPGLVKSRLGKDIGMIKAAWWFRHNANDIIRKLSAKKLWTTILAVSPDKELHQLTWLRTYNPLILWARFQKVWFLSTTTFLSP